jgi:ABC-type uncharacterized transport system permease subunit
MASLKTGTKIGLIAALLAAATARYWFYLASEVALPTDRTLFVAVFLFAAALGVFALVKRTSWLGAIPTYLCHCHRRIFAADRLR